jgi:hypothetical protein
MTTAAIEQPRAGGGRFAAKPSADKPLSPLQQIRAAEVRTDFIVPPPIPIQELNRIKPMGSRARPGDEMEFARNCERQRHMIAWLTATAEAGFPSDLSRAWIAWAPIHPPTKYMLRNVFEEQMAACRRRQTEVVRQAEPELAAIRNRDMRSRNRAALAEKVAKARDALDKALAEQARCEANFAAEEAEVAA